MYALIMAGGRANRMNRNEKALIRLLGKPLVQYVLESTRSAGLNPVVITTRKTPFTINYCRATGTDWICTEGKGYVADLIESAEVLEIKDPFFSMCVDIPGLNGDHIRMILDRYERSAHPALSVWVPCSVHHTYGIPPVYSEQVNGIPVSPAGVNILLGSMVTFEQPEEMLIIDDPALAFNLNCPEDLARAEAFFSGRSSAVLPTNPDMLPR